MTTPHKLPQLPDTDKMFTLYHSFVGEAKGQNSTRKLQMLIVHPSEYFEYAEYFKLDHCLTPLLQDILNHVSIEIPVYLQQQNALIDFKPFAATKDTNFCFSFNALCRLLHLFDSPSWEKRKDHALQKASEDLNQPSFQQLCSFYKRLMPSQRTCGTFSCTEMIDNPHPNVTLMLRIEAKIEKGSNQHTITAWLQYFKSPDIEGGDQEPISYAYDVSLFRLEELVLNLKPHLVKEREIAERANASLDLVTQAMQENDVYGVQFAESPPTLQSHLFSNLHPSQYMFGITAAATTTSGPPPSLSTTAATAVTATTTAAATTKASESTTKKRNYTSKSLSSSHKHTKNK